MAERTLVYRMSPAGQAETIAAIRSVMAEVKRLQAEELATFVAIKAAAAKASSERVRATQAAAKAEAAAAKTAATDTVRAAGAAEREKTRVVERGVGERERVRDRERQTERRGRDRELSEFEKQEREKTRILERERRARERQAETMARREQARAVRDEERRMRDEAFDRKRFFRGVATGFVEGGIGAFSLIGQTATRGVRSVASGLGLNETFDVASIVAERALVARTLGAVGIEARTAGSQYSFDEKGAAAKIRGAAAKWGISQKDLVEAVDVYSEKGSGATAIRDMDKIAAQAVAMNTSAATIAKTRAQVEISARFGGKELASEDIDEVMAQMHFIGKTGVFRAEDVAKESEALFSRFAAGDMDFRTGFKRYGQFINLARGAMGSAPMARNAITALQDSLAKNETKIQGMGIKTRVTGADGAVLQRDFIDVAMDLIEKTGGEGATYNKIVTQRTGGKALTNLVTAFRAAKGGKEGRAAMEKLLAGDESLAFATSAEMMKDAELSIDSEGGRIAQANEKIRQSISATLAPALEKFSNDLPGYASKFVAALDFIQKHPVAAGAGTVGALAVAGGAKALVRWGVGGAARYLGDRMVETVPRLGHAGGGAAGLAGRLLGSAGGMLSSSGATPVYVTGVAPGVGFGGGGGPGDPGSLVKGGAGLGGLAGAEAMAGGAATIGSVMGTVIGPVLAASLAGYVGAKVVGDAIDKTGAFDPRTPGMRGADGVDAAQKGILGKLESEFVHGDADPMERELLADMLGMGKNDPRVDALVSRKGDQFTSSSMGSAGYKAEQLAGQILDDPMGGGPDAWYTEYRRRVEAQEAAERGQTPLGQIVGGNNPTSGTGIMKGAIEADAKVSAFAVSVDKAGREAEKLASVLERLGGNASAIKNAPPR